MTVRNIFIVTVKIQVRANPDFSANLNKVEKISDMLENHLVLVPSTFDTLDSTDNEIADIINFCVPDTVIFFKDKNTKDHASF